MKTGAKVAIGIVVSLVLLVVVFGANILSTRGTMVELEEQFKAKYAANQSNYDSMWKTFKESAQVTDKQAEDFKDVYTSIISGRYENGAGQLMQMVQEDNPKMDTDLYKELQRQIEAGRKTFDDNQKQLLDVIREYNTYVRKHFIAAAILGKDRIDETSYIVTSDATSNAFNTGAADEVKMFE